jgi:C-terminal processing protease CtpA/Prc
MHSQVQGIVEPGSDEKRFDLIDQGDMLVAVNQIPTVRLSLDEVKSLVQGPPGTAVDLSFVRLDGEGRRHQVEVRARRHFELDDADLASAGLDHVVPAP